MFSSNEYFTNEILTKEYVMKFGLDKEAPLEYDGPEIVKCKGWVNKIFVKNYGRHIVYAASCKTDNF